MHRELASDHIVEGGEKGYVVGGDLVGPYNKDNDGNTDAFIGVEVAHSNYGMVGLMKSSESKCTSEVFKQWRVELTSKGDSDRDIVRFHSDDDPSFKKDFKQLLVDESIEQTDTGGYDPQNNSRTERRIGLLKERTRALLFQCTAGLIYYDKLWGVAIKHANYLINRTQFSDGSTPYTKLANFT